MVVTRIFLMNLTSRLGKKSGQVSKMEREREGEREKGAQSWKWKEKIKINYHNKPSYFLYWSLKIKDLIKQSAWKEYKLFTSKWVLV